MLSLFLLSFAVLSWASNTYLPIPPRAQLNCQNCSTVGFDIISLGNGIVAWTDGAYWALAIVNQPANSQNSYRGSSSKTAKSLTVVDAFQGAPYLAGLNQILKNTGATTVKYLVYSHHHTDHIGGAADLLAQFPHCNIIAHQNTYDYLKTVSQTLRPLPTKTFTDKLSLPESGLKLSYAHSPHSVGDIFIYHAASKTLMLVDVVFPRWIPFWNMAISVDIPRFYAVYDDILAFDFVTFVGGHLTRLGDRADVLENQNFIQDLFDTAKRIGATLNFFDFAGSLGTFDPTSNSFSNLWETFSVMLDSGSKQCEQELISRWGGVIGAVDVWAYSQCWALIESLRVDF